MRAHEIPQQYRKGLTKQHDPIGVRRLIDIDARAMQFIVNKTCSLLKRLSRK